LALRRLELNLLLAAHGQKVDNIGAPAGQALVFVMRQQNTRRASPLGDENRPDRASRLARLKSWLASRLVIVFIATPRKY
jgi:hypothetical protein